MTSQDVCTRSHHIRCESELLAVKHKKSPILVQLLLGLPTLPLKGFEPTVLDLDLFCVPLDAALVGFNEAEIDVNHTISLLDADLQAVEVVVNGYKRHPDCLQGDHDLCLCLKALIVIMLGPYFVARIELLHPAIKVV